MVKMASLDEAAVLTFRAAFGENADKVIYTVNKILGQYPEFDSAANNGSKPLKKENKRILEKADEAKSHIENALTLLGEIQQQHPTIYQSISSQFSSILSLKLQSDEVVKTLVKTKINEKEQDELESYLDKHKLSRERLESIERIRIVSPLLDCSYLKLEGLMKTMINALRATDFQGGRRYVKAGEGGHKICDRESTELLYRELDHCWKAIKCQKQKGKGFSKEDFLESLHLSKKGRQRDYEKMDVPVTKTGTKSG